MLKRLESGLDRMLPSLTQHGQLGLTILRSIIHRHVPISLAFASLVMSSCAALRMVHDGISEAQPEVAHGYGMARVGDPEETMELIAEKALRSPVVDTVTARSLTSYFGAPQTTISRMAFYAVRDIEEESFVTFAEDMFVKTKNNAPSRAVWFAGIMLLRGDNGDSCNGYIRMCLKSDKYFVSSNAICMVLCLEDRACVFIDIIEGLLFAREPIESISSVSSLGRHGRALIPRFLKEIDKACVDKKYDRLAGLLGVLSSFGWIPDEGVEMISSIVKGHYPLEVRLAAMWSLRSTPKKQVHDFLLNISMDGDATMRQSALRLIELMKTGCELRIIDNPNVILHRDSMFR